jgi:hypothetical protein
MTIAEINTRKPKNSMLTAIEFNGFIKELTDTKRICLKLLATDLKEPEKEHVSQLKAINDMKLEAAVKAFSR